MQISPVLTPFIFQDFRGKFFLVQKVRARPTGPLCLYFSPAFTGVPSPFQELFLVPVPPQANSVEVKALPIQTNQGAGCLMEHESTENLQQRALLHTTKPAAVMKYHLMAFHIVYPEISRIINRRSGYKILQDHIWVEGATPLFDSSALQLLCTWRFCRLSQLQQASP